jgi:hypothetical protein
MFKKILAGVVTAVLSLGVVALVAGPASAHHNTINPTVTCATDGTYKVTWAVTNSESAKTEVITVSSNPALVPVGTSFAFSQTKTFTQFVTEPQNLELDLTGFWDGDTTTTGDDVYSANSGWFGKDSFPTGCLQVTPSATPQPSVCDGPNHYTSPTYTLTAVTGIKYTVGGVPTAAGVYPAVNGGPAVHIEATVTDSKYKIVGTSVWDFTFTVPAQACTVEVDPVSPDFKQQVCTLPGQHALAQYFIPNTTGVIYSVKINGTETDKSTGWYDVPEGVTAIQIIARGDTANFYTLKGGTKTYDYALTLLGDECLVKVVPKDPGIADGQCDVVDHPGVVPPQTYTLFYVAHVVYQVSTDHGVTFHDVVLTGDQTFPVTPGTHLVVRATVDDPTKYETSGLNFEKMYGDPGDCKGELTPVEPSGVAQYCDETDVTNPILVDGTITLAAVPHVVYFIDGTPAASGVPIPVAPGPHTVTAGVDDPAKYKIKAGAATSWPVDIAGDECLPTEGLVVPAVSSNQVGCFTNGSYTLSNDQADPNAVIWTVNGSQVSQGKYTVSGSGTITITAAPNAPAWGFDPASQTSWTIHFNKPSVCDVETLAMTGQSPTGLLIAADLLVVAGLAMFAMRAVRRGRSQLA